MENKKLLTALKKWLLRFTMAFMLGFANAINQETKTVDDTMVKTELPSKKKSG